MQLSREAWLATALFSVAVVAGCSGADEHPLGGPYGGTAGSLSGPTEGAASGNAAASADDGTDGTDDTSASDNDAGASAKTDGGSSTKTDAGSTNGNGGSTGGQTNTPSGATWTSIYNSYLAGGTIGNCTPCHSGMKTAAGAYAWLKRKGYINGASSGLADPQVSCLSWLGGNMPPNGPSSNATATADLAAWAKAGGLQN
ncbi:MAG: hypothetical protein U0235_29970 [Polyangiaceae bacterium]